MTESICDDRSLDVFLAEHEALRAEQRQRIQTRDNILYLNIVAIGGVFSLAGKLSLVSAVLLIIPWIGLLLGWVHIINDIKTNQIRDYIQHVLFPNIQRLAGPKGAALHCDQWDAHRVDYRKWPIKRISHSIIKIVTFILPGTVAIVAFFTLGGCTKIGNTWLCVLAYGESIMLFWLLLWLDRDFGFRKWHSKKEAKARKNNVKAGS